MRRPLEFRIDVGGASDDLIDYIARKSWKKVNEDKEKEQRARMRRDLKTRTLLRPPQRRGPDGDPNL
jgi:hypothetical protein